MPIEHPWDEIKRVAMDLTNAIIKLNDGKEKIPRRQIEALQKLSKIFKVNLKEVEKEYVQQHFSSSTPTSKESIRTAPRVHSRVTRNNTPGMIPTSEGGGKRSRTDDIDLNLTEAKQERVKEFIWCRVPTYEGGRDNKRVPLPRVTRSTSHQSKKKSFMTARATIFMTAWKKWKKRKKMKRWNKIQDQCLETATSAKVY